MSDMSNLKKLTRPSTNDGQNLLPSDAPPTEFNAPVMTISEFYGLQSYFSDTLLAQAILQQPKGAEIVAATVGAKPKECNVSGYAIAVLPHSQAPVAFEFFAGGQDSASAVQVAAPGSIVRPQGMGMHGSTKSGAFGGFRYGLPAGWLGGGNIYIAVLKTPDAAMYFNGTPEVLFHRQRIQVLDGTDIGEFLPGINAGPSTSYNWPVSFPWANGRNEAGQIQNGSARLSVAPTRTVFRLRVASNVAPAAFNVVSRQDFNLEADRLSVVNAPLVVTQADRLVFPSSTLPGGFTTFPEVEIRDGLIVNQGGNKTRVDILSEVALEAPIFIDILRFGRVG